MEKCQNIIIRYQHLKVQLYEDSMYNNIKKLDKLYYKWVTLNPKLLITQIHLLFNVNLYHQLNLTMH